MTGMGRPKHLLPILPGWGWALVLVWLIVGAIFADYMSQSVMPCATMVAMSQTCIPFGCTKTYINERGEDTGECN